LVSNTKTQVQKANVGHARDWRSKLRHYKGAGETLFEAQSKPAVQERHRVGEENQDPCSKANLEHPCKKKL
jgi:hypothetical protein